jgi:DNA-directed RNA polymerase specialized sigma24 family protein
MNGKHPSHHPVALLRASLCEGGGNGGRVTDAQRRAAVEAARPLVDSLYKMLLLYCDHLVRESALRERMDGADLAHDTWVKVLRYLSGQGGDRVQDETHLRCLLRLSAKRRLLDLLEQERERRRVEQNTPDTWDSADSSGNASETPLERYPDSLATRAIEAVAGYFADGPYGELVEALFEDDETFRKISQYPVRRRSKHYQAYVVCQMGAFLCREARRDVTGGGIEDGLDRELVRLMQEIAGIIGVPREIWQRVEQAVRNAPPCGPGNDGISPELLDAVNRAFDVELHVGNYMSVLKHEMNKFAGR